MLSSAERTKLLHVAADSIEIALAAGRFIPPSDSLATSDGLAVRAASFVTLYRHSQLRGCRGTLEPGRPLSNDVWYNAWSSAFDDPRFDPLGADEWPDIRIGISVLSAMEPLTAASESMLLAALRPGVDGLVIDYDGQRATFLPIVWEQLPDRSAFLGQLKRKAGLAADFWSPELKAWRYTTESFGAGDE